MKCCNKTIEEVEVWFLQDIKNFSARKLCIARCPLCAELNVTLIETRIDDKKVFIDDGIRGIKAVKTLYREAKRVIHKQNKINFIKLNGWIYGINKEIKNKKGQITQIRQYGCEFKSNKKKMFLIKQR